MAFTPRSSASLLAPLALTAAFGLLSAVPASAQNLVQDGGFESDISQNYSASNYFFNLGPSTFGPWTVTNGFVYVDGFGVQSHSGDHSLNLTPGFITSNLTQTLNTVSGQNYLLTFFAAAHSANTFAVKLDGSVITGSPTTLPDTIPEAASDFTGDYREYSLPFLASTNSSVLEFDGQDPDTPGHGPNAILIDDVSVTPAVQAAVPESSSLALLGLGGIGLAFLARKRRA